MILTWRISVSYVKLIPTSQYMEPMSSMNTIRSVLFRESIRVFCGNDTKHIKCVGKIHIFIIVHYVAQVFDALRYKSEGHWFDFPWADGDFSLTWSFRPHYGPGVGSASKRNEH